MSEEDIDILKQVTLLGILNRKADESLSDIQAMLVETGMYTMKEAKKIFKILKEEKSLVDGHLSVKGLTEAKAAEAMFKQG